MKERIFVFSCFVFFTRSCSFDSVLLYSTRSSHRQALILHQDKFEWPENTPVVSE